MATRRCAGPAEILAQDAKIYTTMTGPAEIAWRPEGVHVWLAKKGNGKTSFSGKFTRFFFLAYSLRLSRIPPIKPPINFFFF